MAAGNVETRHGSVHYRAVGEAGHPVLLLAQAGSTLSSFANLHATLAARYRVVALDTLGFGGSGPLPEGAAIGHLAESVVDVMDALGLARSHVYGLHTGNKIAAALAADHPARIGKAALAGQSHSLIPDQDLRNRAIGLVAPKSYGSEPKELPPTLRTLYAANYAFDLEGAARRIAAPTLVVEIATPAEDRTIGRQGPRLQALLRQGSLVTFEAPDGLGITLDERHEELAAPLMRFFG